MTVTTVYRTFIGVTPAFVAAAAAAGQPCGANGESYAQCPDQSNGIYSSTGTNTRAADTFSFDEAQPIGAIDWWGALILGGDGGTFAVSIHADDPNQPGRPGPELQSWSPAVVGEATGETFTTFEVGGTFDEIAFHADLDPPFAASADVTYWLVIQEAFECCELGIFCWEASIDIDTFSMADRGSGSWDVPVGFDLAFTLHQEGASPCPWDCANDDGEVGIEEFLAVLGSWGQDGAPCDFDGNGVGISDFLKVLGLWGACP